MSSFQQLKAKRDRRYPAHAVETASAVVSSVAETSRSTDSHGADAPDIHALPDGLEVRTDKKRGRGLYATKAYMTGGSVLSTTPLQAVLSTSNLSSACSGCLLSPREIEIKTGRAVSLKLCPGCSVLHYCSDACRTVDFDDHEAECMILETIHRSTKHLESPPDLPTEAIRALGRICLNRKKARSVKGKEPEWWSSVTSLEHHLQQLSESELLKQLAGLARQLGRYLAHSVSEEVSREDLFASFGFNSTGELLELCSAFQVNSFTLSLPDVSPIGVTISPNVALANHSCDPNAVVVFPDGGRRMEVVAIRDIAPGEEILTSYIDVSLPVNKRRTELESTYRFTCECTLCLRDIAIRDPGYEGTNVDMREAVWHRDCKRKVKGKGSLPMDWEGQGTNRLKCSRCKEAFELNTSDFLVHYKSATALLDADAKGHDLSQDTSIFQLIPALYPIVTPSSYPLLPLLRLQLLRVRPNTSTELAHLDRLYNIVVTSSTLVYPANHPVLAILHAEWGQILTQTFEGEAQNLVSGRMVKSVETLRKAYELCQKSFGKGGGIEGKRVAEVLRGLEAELQMARSMAR